MRALAPIIVACFLASCSDPVNQSLWTELSKQRSTCQTQVETLKALGVIQEIFRNGADTKVIVNEPRWRVADHKQKVASGLYTYCINAPADGRHTVFIQGSQTNKILGSVSNGNWHDFN